MVLECTAVHLFVSPILFIETNRSHTEIEFPLLELEMTLPPSVKCKDSAIRALWLSYDHFSDYSPSFEIPFKVDTTIGMNFISTNST